MNSRERQDLDRHITGNYGEDQFKEMESARMGSYREYMGPSGNGMSDKQLRKLAGWSSFCAGWDAATDWTADV